MGRLRQPRQSEAERIEIAVRNRYRHPLAQIEATEAELASLEQSGFTLTPLEIRDRLAEMRVSLLTAAGVKS
ncbi:MAG: hypothetical protein ACM3YM_06745 [Sphingomonadales bacterium]